MARAKILIADDEPTNLHLMAALGAAAMQPGQQVGRFDFPVALAALRELLRLAPKP